MFNVSKEHIIALSLANNVTPSSSYGTLFVNLKISMGSLTFCEVGWVMGRRQEDPQPIEQSVRIQRKFHKGHKLFLIPSFFWWVFKEGEIERFDPTSQNHFKVSNFLSFPFYPFSVYLSRIQVVSKTL